MARRIAHLYVLLALVAQFAWPQRSPATWLDLDAGETSPSMSWRGGSGSLQVWGDFTGPPTVTIQWRSWASAPWVTLPSGSTGCTFTAAGMCNFQAGSGELQIVVAGGSGTDIVSGHIGGKYAGSGGGGAGVSGTDTRVVFIDGTTAGEDAEFSYDKTDHFVTVGDLELGRNTAEIRWDSGSFWIREGTDYRAAFADVGGSMGFFVTDSASNVQAGIRDVDASATTASLIYDDNPTRGIGGAASAGSLIFGSASSVTWNADAVQVSDGLVLGLPVSSSAPGSPSTGDMYYDDTNNTICVYTGSGFVQTDDYSTACN